MITMIATTIVLSILQIVSIIVIRNLLIQNNKYETYIEFSQENFFEVLDDVKQAMTDTLRHMKELDKRQMFEKDDEVGQIFQEMADSIEELDHRITDLYNKLIENYGSEEERN